MPLLFVWFHHATFISDISFLFQSCLKNNETTRSACMQASVLTFDLLPQQSEIKLELRWSHSINGSRRQFPPRPLSGASWVLSKALSPFWQSVVIFTELLNPGDTTGCDSHCDRGSHWFRVSLQTILHNMSSLATVTLLLMLFLVSDSNNHFSFQSFAEYCIW